VDDVPDYHLWWRSAPWCLRLKPDEPRFENKAPSRSSADEQGAGTGVLFAEQTGAGMKMIYIRDEEIDDSSPRSAAGSAGLGLQPFAWPAHG